MKTTAMDTSEIIYGYSTPRLESPNPNLPSVGPIIGRFADELQTPLYPWQQHVLDRALQLRPDGQYHFSTVGVLVPRQQGKTHLMRMKMLSDLFIFGTRSIIGMSQTRQLSLDTFKKTVELAESLDWTRKRIKRVSRTNGQEELEVYCHHYPKNCTEKCNRIRTYSVRAATTEGPRGSTADLLYIDELREISEAVWQAARPLTTATGGQTWITSNAGDATSTVLNDLRNRALSNRSQRLGWFEWSAPPGTEIDDREGWLWNPSLGFNPAINMEAIADWAATEHPDAFKTERLSMWIESLDSPWPMPKWNDGEMDIALEDGLPTWMALDLNFKRDSAFLVTVQEREEGLAVFMHEWKQNPELNHIELVSDIAELARRFRPRVFAYDPNTSGFLAPLLERAQIQLTATPWQSAGFAIMCDQTLAAMSQGVLVHPKQESLYNQLLACSRAPASDGGWRIRRRDSTIAISGAVAMVMAVGHASTPIPVAAIMSA